VAQGAAGALAGAAGVADVRNVYVNAAVASDDLAGDLIGAGSETLSVSNSYAAGKFNNSQATSAFGDEFGTSTQNLLYFGVQNQAEICDIANKWQGWHEDGTIGNGWPLLQWQVERGDYAALCGFGIEGDINGDGDVNIADAQKILIYIANNISDKAADLNHDGAINIADAQKVLIIIANK
jgi:hypothetical protein